MVLFGFDASHHQGTLDMARFRHEAGVEFGFFKATEGSSFVDSKFNALLVQGRDAGLLVAAYHYQRNEAAAGQVVNIQRAVPKDVPVLVDVEADSGNAALTFDLVARLRSAGYRVPLTYLPRWYWQQIGSPSLVGLPPLWSSRYPNNVSGTLAAKWAEVPSSYWNGYGGLSVEVLQFTSSGQLPGYSGLLDLNAYRGTRAQLATLLGYTQAATRPNEEDIMPKPILYRQTNQPAVYAVTPMGRWWLPTQTDVNDFADKWGLPLDVNGNAVIVVGDSLGWAGPDLSALVTDAHTAANSGTVSTGGGSTP
jgi:lysozyme